MSINPDGFFLIEHIFISVPLYYNWVLFAAVMVALFSFALIFIMQRKIVKGKNELGFRTGIMESANKMLGELLEERKRTELSLKESEAKYRLLVENQSDLIVKVDVKGKFLFVSPSYCRLFGKNQDELLGKTFLPLVHPDDRESTEEAMKQLYQPPWTCQLEQRALTVEGWKWLAWTDTAMLNDEGDVVAIIGTGRDITAQKEAELALRESENRWLMALDGTGDGVWDWNIIDNELFFSPNWKKMLGYETHEVGSTYQSWERLVHPADLEKAVHLLQLHIDGQSEKYFAEYRMLTKEGSWKWVLDRGKVVEFNPEGKPIRMTGTHTDITDFKINQEELQKQNVFIYTILDNLPIGVAVNYFDSGKASYMNETFAKIYGWEANLLTDTEKFFECVYPDPAYRKKMIERVVSDMNSGDPALMRWDEVEIATQRGEKRYVSAWNIPLPEQNVMISTVRDVTSKVLDHKQMLQHQNMLRYIIRHDPSAIAVFDTDMSYLFVSQRYAQDYRIEDPDIIGKNHYEVFPEISENWRNIHQRAMQGEVLQKKEDKFPRADGSVDYTSWECRPWYKNQEIIGGIVIYTEVITERKKAELNLHEQRDKLQLLFDISRAIGSAQSYKDSLQYTLVRICKTSGWEIGEVWEPDPVHACLNITPAWYAVSSELQGFREKSEKYTFAFGQGLPGLAYDTQKPVWMFNIQSNRQFLRGAEAQDFKLNTAVGFPVLAADEVVNVMVFFSREKREEEENLMNIFSGMGLQLGEFFRRKLAEEQTRMLNEDLEQRVEVRTQQLEAANKELEAFTYSVSHDLRAPLRAITGFSQILAADYDLVLDEEAKRLLGIVKSNAKEMDKLITDLLAFSRIGKGALRKTVVDMKAMALKVFDEVARSNNSVIALRINDLPEVCVDSALMLQVWRNLLSNAVKFSLAGPDPIIEIEGYEKKNELVYVVRDNGVGFDDQYKEKIFQVFQRLHRHDEFEGTGVGLAIVQRVIHRHEGRVWAEGIPGEGACFWFALPKNS